MTVWWEEPGLNKDWIVPLQKRSVGLVAVVVVGGEPEVRELACIVHPVVAEPAAPTSARCSCRDPRFDSPALGREIRGLYGCGDD